MDFRRRTAANEMGSAEGGCQVNNELQHFRGVRPSGENQFTASCPLCEPNRTAGRGHCQISFGDNGKLLLSCLKCGASFTEICKAAGIPLNGNGKRQDAATRPPRARKPQTHDGADDAAAAAEKDEPSRIVETYPYVTADGEFLYEVVRFEPKDFRPRRSDANGGWIWNLKGMPRVLYRLPELLAVDPAGWVFVVEGEKDVNTGWSIGLPCTWAAGGAWKDVDAAALDNRDVVIIADADTAGRTKAQALAGRLHGRAASVCVIEMPGAKDLSAWVETLDARTAEELRDAVLEMAEAAPLWAPTATATGADEELVKKHADAPPYQPYPTDKLPEALRDFVNATAVAIGVDPAMVALPTLAMTAAAIGTTRAAMPKYGWYEPAILWTAVVAGSGSKKSPTLKAVLEPLRRIDSEHIAHNRELLAQHEAALKQHKSEDGTPAPQRPALRRCIVRDATTEALLHVLSDNARGVLVDSDELSGWLLSFDKYRAKGGGDCSMWLSAWAAERVIVDRATRPTIEVARAAVSIAGMIQPEMLSRCVGQEHQDDGLLPRLLLAMPPRRPALWSTEIVPREVQRRVELVVAELSQLSFDEHGRTVNVLLNDAALRTFVEYHDDMARTVAAESGTMAATLSKSIGYALRLALVIHVVREADARAGYGNAPSREIEATDIDAGIRLAQWHVHEMKRVLRLFGNEGQAEPDDGLTPELRSLLAWITERGGSATVPEISRGVRRYRGSATEARTALQGLADAGRGTFDGTTFAVAK